MQFQFSEVSESQALFGDHFRSSAGNMSFGFDAEQGWYTVIKQNQQFSGNIPSADTTYEVEFYAGETEQYLKIDGLDEITDTQTLSGESSTNLFLLARNASTFEPARARLYYAKIYVGDELVRDFVPAMRKRDSEVGLYDKVSGLFFTNIGTGEFAYGSIVADNV